MDKVKAAGLSSFRSPCVRLLAPVSLIPAIDAPQFVSVSEADVWLQPQEPVVLVAINGDARAYPIQILMWHEIANDTVGGVPVAVTFCPLCNTAIVFDRRVDEQTLDFGTTGRLRYRKTCLLPPVS